MMPQRPSLTTMTQRFLYPRGLYDACAETEERCALGLFPFDLYPNGSMTGAERGGMFKRAQKTERRVGLPVAVSKALEAIAQKREAEAEARSELLATIESQIIPQLVLAHCVAEAASVPQCADARMPPTDAEVEAFAKLAVDQDIAGALAFIEKMGSEGISLESVLLDLLAPAGRLLGEQWLEDDRSFTEVTIGLSSIQQIVRILSPGFSPGLANRGMIVLVSPEVEQHTLGIYLCAEFLRQAGWSVQVAPCTTDAALVEMVAAERIAMVGVSVSNDQALDRLDSFVAAVRRVSLDQRVALMVGGSHPELAARAQKLGAIYCNDPREAVRLLDEYGDASDSGF